MKTFKLLFLIAFISCNLCYAQLFVLYNPDFTYVDLRMSTNQQMVNNLIPCIAYPAYNLNGKNCDTSIMATSESAQLPILGVSKPQSDEKILSPLVVATAESHTKFYNEGFKIGKQYVTRQYEDFYSNYNDVRMYTNVRTTETILANATNNVESGCNDRPCTIFDGDEYFHNKLYKSSAYAPLRLDEYKYQQISPSEYFMGNNLLNVRFKSTNVSDNLALITNDIIPKIKLGKGGTEALNYHLRKLAKNSYNTLATEVCQGQGYGLVCYRTSHDPTTVHYVLGYGDSSIAEDGDFPHLTLDTESLELEAYAIVVDPTTNFELLRKKLWKSRYNWQYEIPRRHPRELVEEIHSTKTANPNFIFNVKTEITSEEIFGDDYDEWWASADDMYYANITTNNTGIPNKEYDEILLEITELKEETITYIDEEDEDGDGDVEEEISYTTTYPEVVNTIEVENYTDGHFIALKVEGDKAVFVSKTENDAVVQTLAENCISPFPNNGHYMTNDEGIFALKTGDQLVWRKLKGSKDDPIRCVFPEVGQSSLTSNQKLIVYNQKPNDNQLHYLLSEDKTKVTIKVGNELRVIDEQAFINANYSFIDAVPIQTFNLNSLPSESFSKLD